MADTPAAAGGDPYATAKANIRDTVKWLAATFAAIAGVVVGGSSFAGLGGLPPDRLAIAILGVGAGYLLIAIALYRTIRLLQPGLLFPLDLAAPQGTASRKDSEELKKLRKEINDRKADLLPPKCESVEKLLADAQEARQAMQVALNEDNEARFKQNDERYKELSPYLEQVLDVASYLRLYRSVMSEIPVLFGLGTGALFFLLVFAWSAHQSKAGDAKPMVVLAPSGTPSADCAKKTAALPRLDPVLFATGRADVTPEGLKEIGKARDLLRTSAEALLLLLAHTDTVAPAGINRTLARRRGEAVRQLLLEPGGIAPGRVFVAELPKLELPELTGQETASSRNRSVEMMALLPQGC